MYVSKMAEQTPETEIEFAVQMTCSGCVEDVKKVLENQEGINHFYVNLENELVLVRSTLPSSKIQELLESTGKLVVFRGYGGSTQQGDVIQEQPHHGAAVAIMKGMGAVKGLARMVQVSPEQCVIEGTVDGLSSLGEYTIAVHEFGDLSQGCMSCGDVFGTPLKNTPGLLGTVKADKTGRATFYYTSDRLMVSDIIGRSMLVHSGMGPHTTARVMCGIIARSAGLFQNKKKVCTCDGVTIWEEAAAKRSKSEDTMKSVL